MNDEAVANIIAGREMSVEQCEIQKELAISLTKADLQLEIDYLNAELETETEKNATLLELRDQEISSLRKEIKPNKTMWAFFGGFLLASGTSLGTKQIINEEIQSCIDEGIFDFFKSDEEKKKIRLMKRFNKMKKRKEQGLPIIDRSSEEKIDRMEQENKQMFLQMWSQMSTEEKIEFLKKDPETAKKFLKEDKMQITKEQLRQIIIEELESMMGASKGMRLPKYNMPEVAKELETAYNSDLGSIAAPNYEALAERFISSETVYKMEDYANMLQFREDDWRELNPSKSSEDLMKLVNWIDRFHKVIR
jgi:hypothetical protein